MLQQLLNDSKMKNERLERQYLEAQEKTLVLENEMRALSEDNTSPRYGNFFPPKRGIADIFGRSEAFLQLRKALDKANDELSKREAEVSRLEVELSNTKFELAAIATDCKFFISLPLC